MKVFPQTRAGRRRRHCRAFSLWELQIATGIYMVVFVAAMIAIQVFGLRVYALASIRLAATQGAQKALNQIRDDIRQGKLLQVGNTDNAGNFTALAGTNSAMGTALQIFSTTNQGPPYSIYYLQTNTLGAANGSGGISSNVLWWVAVTSNATTAVNLACFVTNLDVFAAEDWQDSWPGSYVTNSVVNNQVYSVKLRFYQWAYPIAGAGPGASDHYGFYQLQTRVCRRALN
jgi:hypothetical protein